MPGRTTPIDLSEFRVKKSTPCIAARKSQELRPEDKLKFAAACAEKDITNQAIADWMLGRGVKVSRDAVRLHRVGECCCGR
jgi:hypothetical protein